MAGSIGYRPDVDTTAHTAPRPGPPEFTEELRMRQETDGVLLESYLIYEQEHQVTPPLN